MLNTTLRNLTRKEQPMASYNVNRNSIAFAKTLIKKGQINLTTSWGEGKPTPQVEDAYVKKNGYADYGLWFIGVNGSADVDTKTRYAFPYGNFKQVYRSGVEAARDRAAQYGHTDVEKAASLLLILIDRKVEETTESATGSEK